MRDHGPGIAAADLPHLFDRFYRGAASRAARLGHRHGPVDRARPAGRPAGPHLGREPRRRRRGVHHRGACRGASVSRSGPPRRMTAPARILLVDDEVAIQRAVGPLLRSRGYAVDIAATGARRAPDVRRAPAGSRAARSRLAGSRRHRGLPADPGATSTRRSSCCRRAEPKPTRSTPSTSAPTTTSPSRSDRRSCSRASGSRCAAPPRGSAAERRLPRRRAAARLRPPPGAPRRHRDPSHAEGVRAALAARAQPRSRADPPRHPQGDLGPQRCRSDRSICGRWWRSCARRSSRTPARPATS